VFDATYFTKRLHEDTREMKHVSVVVYLESGFRFLASKVLAAEPGYVVFQVYPTEDGEPLGQGRWLERMRQRGTSAPLERVAVAYDTISHVQVIGAVPGSEATVGFHIK